MVMRLVKPRVICRFQRQDTRTEGPGDPAKNSELGIVVPRLLDRLG